MSKRITDKQALGQRGVNLVEAAVLEMGLVWHPTNAALDAGIDGYVELRDPDTGDMTACVQLVQSKARTVLERETEHSFEFTPDRADLDYWSQSNAPVLLVVSRPDTREAWWVCVQRYFAEPGRAGSRRIVFDKTRDRFDKNAGSRVRALAMEHRPGLYSAPPRVREELVSNLLAVKRLPSALYMAESEHRDGKSFADALFQGSGRRYDEWLLREGRVFSVHDLRERPWTGVCDQGTVERIETVEWSSSEDPQTLRNMVQLLNHCLKAVLRPRDVFYQRELECYYFGSTPTLQKRVFGYRSRENHTEREVFCAVPSKLDPTRLYYRHSAFAGRFRTFEGRWFLEINPTYVFTRDGREVDAFHPQRVSALRRLEGHEAVFGQLLMFSRLLEDPHGLFAQPYPHLGFGDLERMEIDGGILDEVWRAPEGTATPPAEEQTPEGDTPTEEDADGLLFNE